MNKISRTLSLSLVAALTIGCIVGCSDKKEEKPSDTPVSSQTSVSSEKESETNVEEPVDYKGVDFRVCWFGDDLQTNATIAFIEEFEKDYKNLKVEVEYLGWDDYWSKISTQATGSELPDVFLMDYSMLGDYAKSGMLLPLNDYISSGELDMSKVPENLVSDCAGDGQIYSVSKGMNALVYAYDVAALEKAGVTISQTPTLEEYIEVCKKVRDATGAVSQVLNLEDWARMHGHIGYFAEDGKTAAFTAEDLAAYWEFVKVGQEEKYFLGPDIAITGLASAVAEGVMWNNRVYSNQIESIEASTGKEMEVFTGFPSTDKNEAPSYFKPALMWVVSSACENPELAIEFLNFQTNDTRAFDHIGMMRGVPINSEMEAYLVDKGLSAAQEKGIEHHAVIKDGYVSKIFPVEPAGSAEAKTVTSKYEEQVTYGTIKKEDYLSAAQEAVEKINRILAESQK